jgi:hypothetical protein
MRSRRVLLGVKRKHPARGSGRVMRRWSGCGGLVGWVANYRAHRYAGGHERHASLAARARHLGRDAKPRRAANVSSLSCGRRRSREGTVARAATHPHRRDCLCPGGLPGRAATDTGARAWGRDAAVSTKAAQVAAGVASCVDSESPRWLPSAVWASMEHDPTAPRHPTPTGARWNRPAALSARPRRDGGR